jgi:hypothetical protein
VFRKKQRPRGVRVSERLFIDVEANWLDVEGCGGNQSPSWSFRLTRSD